MGVRREFLGWERPALEQAAEYLSERFGRDGRADLRQVVVVVPGARAGRRLQELLVEACERKGWALLPPKVVTVGQLPELLYVAKKPFADELVQLFAWVQTLQEAPEQERSLLIPEPPAPDNTAGWLTLAERLGQLHRELAAERLDFSAVANQLEKIAQKTHSRFTQTEVARWRLLRRFQQEYLSKLDALELWDKQTARLFAIEHRECRTDCWIVLVGTVDLNRALQAMLEQVAERVTALVFAPAELKDRFDSYGCLIPAKWQKEWVELEDEQIRVVDGPEEQAEEVVRVLAELKEAGQQWDVDDVVVGVPDERVVPFLQQRLEECGLPVRYGGGEKLGRSGPVRFVQIAADFLSSGSYTAYAALLRHPDVYEWLQRRNVSTKDPVTALDAFYQQHLPQVVDTRLLDEVEADEDVRKVLKAVNQLLEPLRQAEPGNLAEALRKTLVALYEGRRFQYDLSTDLLALRACRELVTTAQEIDGVPSEVRPDVSVTDILHLVVQQVSEQTAGSKDGEPAVSLLGWLELPLGDAPVLIITGMNEGIVPSSLNADQFLPDGLRRELNVEDSTRRFARDLYALKLLQATRRHLVLITARRTADNEPLLPSRLLFPHSERLPARTCRLTGLTPPGSQSKPPLVLPQTLRPGRTHSAFTIPTLKAPEEPSPFFRVTEFRDFLLCPYRYFLKRRLGLSSCDDTGRELSPSTFGELIHQVLRDFGQEEELKDCTRPEPIEEFLVERLKQLARQQFSSRPQPSIRIQLAQAQLRLQAFARCQAEWRSRGWRIHTVEHLVHGKEAPFSVFDKIPEKELALLKVSPKYRRKEAYLIGRIDRVDIHEPSGTVVILDYKTSDLGKTPEETHRIGRQDDRQWVDLQLPLYRHLIKALDLEYDNLLLGYVLLPRELAATRVELAEWTPEELDDADREAARIILAVWEHQIGEPVTPPPPFSKELARICQDDLYVQTLSSGGEQGFEE